MTIAFETGGRERDDGGDGGAAAAAKEAVVVVPPPLPLPPVQFWLPGFPAYKSSVAGHSGDDGRQRRRHRDRASSVSSATMSSSVSSHLIPPPPPVVTSPPVFLAFGVRRVYTCVSGHRSARGTIAQCAREACDSRCRWGARSSRSDHTMFSMRCWIGNARLSVPELLV